jgi:N-acetylmuramoyl-L-alanine amidase
MDIIVNAGHTAVGSGSGAVYKGWHESDICRDVTRALIPLLRKKGHTVKEVTVDRAATQAAYLKSVCQLANNADAELFISLHCNASVTHLGKGCEAYTWKGRKVKQAVRICDSLADLCFRNRGVKDGSKLYVVKHTRATAVLVELFFLDSTTDRALYAKLGPAKIAEAIAKAL